MLANQSPELAAALKAFRQKQADTVLAMTCRRCCNAGDSAAGHAGRFLGGGQLGRMFVTAAKRMGYRVTVLDPTRKRQRRSLPMCICAPPITTLRRCAPGRQLRGHHHRIRKRQRRRHARAG